MQKIAQNIFSDFDTDRFRDRFSDEELVSTKYFDCDVLIIDDLGTDSLDLVELIMALEDEFGIEIPDNAAEQITTVNDVVEYLKKLDV